MSTASPAVAVRPEIGKAVVEVVRHDHATQQAYPIELCRMVGCQLHVERTKLLVSWAIVRALSTTLATASCRITQASVSCAGVQRFSASAASSSVTANAPSTKRRSTQALCSPVSRKRAA